jgi:hypothetical protein
MFCNRFSKDHTRFKSFLLASTFRSLRFVDRSLGSRIQDPEDPNTGRGGDGIGMALFEETICDPQNGAPINSKLEDYMLTVHADALPIDGALPRLSRRGDQRAWRMRDR